MDMQVFLSKLKELKSKMAELESMEDELPHDEQKNAEETEGQGMNAAEEAMGVEKHDDQQESPSDDNHMSDDDMLEAFGKKKKPVSKGLMVAISLGKAKKASGMGKYK